MSRSYEDRKALFSQTTLYTVVTPEFCLDRPVTEVVKAILDGGAKLLQLRFKNRESDLEFYHAACRVRELTLQYEAVLIIDDRIDIALASDADGVHLGQGDLPVSAARRIAPQLLFGVSTHNPEEIAEANRSGADYLNVGPIFPTATKQVSYPAVGLDNLKRWMPQIKIPFSVMGGIKSSNMAELSRIGAKRQAMVTEITQAKDISGKVRELISLLENSK